MKKILAGLLIGTMLAVPVSAEIQTYSDDYISFEYDDEMIGEIAKRIEYEYDYDYIEYYVRTMIRSKQEKGTVAKILITSSPTTVDVLFTEEDTEDYTVTLESDDPLTSKKEFRKENEGTNFNKVLAQHGDQYVISIISTNEIGSERYNNCKNIVDSVVVSNNFIENGYIPKDTQEKYEEEEILYNKRFSEQGIKYAQAIIDVCNKYMDMEIGGKEASDTIEELRNRLESYKDVSEYFSDSDIYWEIFNANYYFSTGKDAKIIQIIDKMQEIIDCGTEE